MMKYLIFYLVFCNINYVLSALTKDEEYAVTKSMKISVTEEDVLAAKHGFAPPLKFYSSYKYSEAIETIHQLAKSCRHIMKVYTASEMFPYLEFKPDYFKCGNTHCEIYNIHLGLPTASKSNPEVYFVSGIHGDEPVGVDATLEFLHLVCHMYGKHPIITEMIDTRSIWLTPIANPWGYYRSKRDEDGYDPNRDFPLRTENCLKTLAARNIHQLFKEHLFQISLSIHSGSRSISTPWNANYFLLKESPIKTKPNPDYLAYEDVGDMLKKSAGYINSTHTFGTNFEEKFPKHAQAFSNVKWFLPSGVSSEFYGGADGTFEDWSYSASWFDASLLQYFAARYPYEHKCSPNPKLPPFPSEELEYYHLRAVSSLSFTVELNDDKKPSEKLYGHSTQVIKNEISDGIIPRALRVMLKAAEVVKPRLYLVSPPAYSFDKDTETADVSMQLIPLGCSKLNNLTALMYDPDNYEKTPLEIDMPNLPISCYGFSIWEWYLTPLGLKRRHPFEPYNIKIDFKIDMLPKDLMLEASMDFHWTWIDKDPHPPAIGLSHLVNSRILITYKYATEKVTLEQLNRMYPQEDWPEEYKRKISMQKSNVLWKIDTTPYIFHGVTPTYEHVFLIEKLQELYKVYFKFYLLQIPSEELLGLKKTPSPHLYIAELCFQDLSEKKENNSHVKFKFNLFSWDLHEFTLSNEKPITFFDKSHHEIFSGETHSKLSCHNATIDIPSLQLSLHRTQIMTNKSKNLPLYGINPLLTVQYYNEKSETFIEQLRHVNFPTNGLDKIVNSADVADWENLQSMSLTNFFKTSKFCVLYPYYFVPTITTMHSNPRKHAEEIKNLYLKESVGYISLEPSKEGDQLRVYGETCAVFNNQQKYTLSFSSVSINNANSCALGTVEMTATKQKVFTFDRTFLYFPYCSVPKYDMIYMMIGDEENQFVASCFLESVSKVKFLANSCEKKSSQAFTNKQKSVEGNLDDLASTQPEKKSSQYLKQEVDSPVSQQTESGATQRTVILVSSTVGFTALFAGAATLYYLKFYRSNKETAL